MAPLDRGSSVYRREGLILSPRWHSRIVSASPPGGARETDQEEWAMAVTRWDPFSALSQLDRELDSSFDELVRRAWGNGQRGTAGYVPAVDIRKDGGDVLISVELPGVDIDKDVSIEVANGRLTIAGERRDEHMTQSEQGEQSKGVLVRELRYGAFRRDFALPEHISADDVDATYDRGMLRVLVRNVTKPVPEPRRIQVRNAEQPREVEAERTVQGQVEG